MERAHTTVPGSEQDTSIEPQADSPVQGRRRPREEAHVASSTDVASTEASPARDDDAPAAVTDKPADSDDVLEAKEPQADTAGAAAADGMGARANTLDTHQPRPTALSNYSGEHPPADKEPPRGHRAQLLRSSLRPAEEAMFRMPIQEWLRADREALGWRCSVPRPTSMSALQPLPVDAVKDVAGAEALVSRVQGKFYIFDGPVTALATDAIVNAANEGCMGGGGVDGAIHSAAGPLLMRECATFHGCATGHTRITKGYALPARTVLHTVGPIGERPKELKSCYQTCVTLGRRFGLRSIGFCCVSTGIFGYPLQNATVVALTQTIKAAMEGVDNDPLQAYVFACFKREEANVYRSFFPKVLKAVATNIVNADSGKL